MCGRFTLKTPTAQLAEQFELPETPELPARFNIAPTQPVAAVRVDPTHGERTLTTLRWGLVPSWAKTLALGAQLINARAETVASKPAFRAALPRRRCLILADGFYEWLKQGRAKQPIYFTRTDARPFAFAGLWETWRDPSAPTAPPLLSCTLITTTPNAVVAPVHDRMPLILAPDAYATWLDPNLTDAAQALAALRLDPALTLHAYPVSTHVNSAFNDDPTCIIAVSD